MDQVEEIKSKLDIVQIVGEYVQLKKAGVNWKGPCPFHNEKTPSFMVNPDKGIFHCFGCSKGGDVYTFIQEIEGMDFPEALKLLADKAGVKLERHDPRITSQKNRLLDMITQTTAHWQHNLTLPVAASVREYLTKRGLKQETIEEFKLGYAIESWDEIMKFLNAKQFNEAEMFQAGLTAKKEGTSRSYDRFRDRLVFPIQDLHGTVVGFTGRTMSSEDIGAKYINTPEGLVYHKGKTLYGLDKAKKAIREVGYAVVVEGNMDVITCHEAGYKNVVACSGTALTADQIQLLKRYTENIALCFDEDEAGQAASSRSIDLLLAAEINVKIVKLTCGKDPDECIRTDVKAWEESLKTSKLVMQFYFDKYLTPEVLADINKKKPAVATVLKELNKIANSIEKDHWLKELSNRIDVSEVILREAMPSTSKEMKTHTPYPITHNSPEPSVEQKEKQKPRSQEYSERILTILLNHPEFIGYAQEYFLPEFIYNEKLKDLYKKVILWYNSAEEKSSREQLNSLLNSNINSEDGGYIDSLFLYVDKIYENFDQPELQEELVKLIETYKINFLGQKVNHLNSQLATAEQQGNKQEVDRLIKEIQILSENLAKLK